MPHPNKIHQGMIRTLQRFGNHTQAGYYSIGSRTPLDFNRIQKRKRETFFHENGFKIIQKIS